MPVNETIRRRRPRPLRIHPITHMRCRPSGIPLRYVIVYVLKMIKRLVLYPIVQSKTKKGYVVAVLAA